MTQAKRSPRPPKTTELLNEYGRSGTRIMSGVINEEYNIELKGKNGLEKFDKMRKSDATVQAVVFSIELPILSTEWYIEPGMTKSGTEEEVTEKDEEIRLFVEEALFGSYLEGGTFKDYLRQAIGQIVFGYALHEKVYKIEDGKIYLKKLAHRLARTIYAWREDGIEQYLSGDDRGSSFAFIPFSKLVLNTFRKEGDNLEGTSILRAAYKHWYIKDKLYKLEAVKHERQSVGVPFIKVPNAAKKEDKLEAKKILENMRANENAFVVLPGADWEAGFLDMGQSTTSKVSESIAHHDRAIAKSVLAQFLELGAKEGGSYALSEDQSTLFLVSLTALASDIAQVVNQQIIRELVDLNFTIEKNQTYPTIAFGKIGNTKYSELADTMSTLVSSGIITKDENLEEYVRKQFGLPQISEVEEEEVDMGDEELDDMPEDDLEEDDPEDIDAEMELLESETENLKASEIERIYSENEAVLDFSEDLSESSLFRSLSQAQKDAISQGLIDYWKRKGKKKPTVKDRNDSFKKKAKDAGDKIRKSLDDLDKKIAPLQSEIDNIKNSSLGKKAKSKKIKELRSKIKAMRDGASEGIKLLKSIKKDALQGEKQTRETIKKRKQAVNAMIKQINEELKARTATRSESIKYLRDQIRSNIETYSTLKSQAKSKEEKANLKKIYQALKSENESLRSAGRKIRDEISSDKGSVKAKKDQLKSDLEKYNIDDDTAKALGFADVDEMVLFAESKKAFSISPIITAQNG